MKDAVEQIHGQRQYKNLQMSEQQSLEKGYLLIPVDHTLKVINNLYQVTVTGYKLLMTLAEKAGQSSENQKWISLK